LEVGAVDEEHEAEAHEASIEIAKRLESMQHVAAVLDFVNDSIEAEGLYNFYRSRGYDKRLWEGAAKFLEDSL
jgi:hypothetical protein